MGDPKLNEQLFNAIGTGNFDEVKRLIQHIATYGAENPSHTFPPSASADGCFGSSSRSDEEKDPPAGKMWTAVTAAVNAKNRFGYTPLMVAARAGDLDIAKLLLDHGADINAITNTDGGTTPLSRAASGGHLEMAKFLLKHGANINAKTWGYYTAFYSALVGLHRNESCRDVAKFLVQNGANVDERDESGRTMLMDFLDVLPIATLLLELGSDVNLQDNYGDSALNMAEVDA